MYFSHSNLHRTFHLKFLRPLLLMFFFIWIIQDYCNQIDFNTAVLKSHDFFWNFIPTLHDILNGGCADNMDWNMRQTLTSWNYILQIYVLSYDYTMNMPRFQFQVITDMTTLDFEKSLYRLQTCKKTYFW